MYFLQQHLVFVIWGLMPERTTSDWTECIRIKNIKHFLVKSFYFKVLNTNPWSLIMKECSSKINLWNKENQSRMFVIRLNFPSNTLWKHANTNQWFWVFIYCKSNTQNTTSKGIRPLQTIEYSCEKMRTGKQNPKQNLGQQNRKSLKTPNPGQNTHLVLPSNIWILLLLLLLKFWLRNLLQCCNFHHVWLGDGCQTFHLRKK